ncbi:hypothetical protein ACWCXK_39025 [Streptomyces sp. NPDC001739]
MGERSGERWSAAEYAQLARELGSGQDSDIEAIPEADGRTVSAIRSAAARMISADEKVPHRAAHRWVAERLAEGYDWESVLRSRLLDDGIRYWSAEDDAAFTEAWTARCPLPELARRFQCGERAVAEQMMRLGLADTLIEVVNRLGAEPGGTLELRRVVVSADAVSHAGHVALREGRASPLCRVAARHAVPLSGTPCVTEITSGWGCYVGWNDR